MTCTSGLHDVGYGSKADFVRIGRVVCLVPIISHGTMSPDCGDDAKLDSSMVLCGAPPEKQTEKVEKPDHNGRYRRGHVGPSRSSQDLLDSSYLLT